MSGRRCPLCNETLRCYHCASFRVLIGMPGAGSAQRLVTIACQDCGKHSEHWPKFTTAGCDTGPALT